MKSRRLLFIFLCLSILPICLLPTGSDIESYIRKPSSNLFHDFEKYIIHTPLYGIYEEGAQKYRQQPKMDVIENGIIRFFMGFGTIYWIMMFWPSEVQITIPLRAIPQGLRTFAKRSNSDNLVGLGYPKRGHCRQKLRLPLARRNPAQPQANDLAKKDRRSGNIL